MSKPNESRAPRTGRWASSALLLCLVATPGCTVGPDFRRPDAAAPAQWAGPEPSAQGVTPADAALATWWTAFADSKLTSIVEKAMESNLDL